MPLDPLHLTPAASLNRLRIVDLPGVTLEPDVRGKTANDLLAARAIAGLVRRRAGALGLAGMAGAGDAALLPALGRRLASDDPGVREAAEDVAREAGRSLGYMLLALRRGDHVNREARPEWDEGHWVHWAGIRAVWLGGGVVGGSLGPRLRDHAAAVLAENGVADLDVRLAAHPAILPLLGAARSVAAPGEAAVVLDFGGSFVKRALAIYDGGALAALRPLPPLPAPSLDLAGREYASDEEVARLVADMADALARTWREAAALGAAPIPSIVASVAAYVRDGHPLPRQGGQLGMYAQLHLLPENASRWLARRLGERVGQAVEVALVHDGMAAARTYAGEERAAVILLGTSLGVGFPPAEGGLRPLAPDFAIAATG